jgi:4-alpha-glucanotransferase
MGWWNSQGGDSTRSAADVRREKARARAYLNTRGTEMNWTLIRTAMASVAHTVIFPAQDVLGLGSEARMNTPSVPSGNWRWRLNNGELTSSLSRRLRTLAALYQR